MKSFVSRPLILLLGLITMAIAVCDSYHRDLSALSETGKAVCYKVTSCESAIAVKVKPNAKGDITSRRATRPVKHTQSNLLTITRRTVINTFQFNDEWVRNLKLPAIAGARDLKQYL